MSDLVVTGIGPAQAVLTTPRTPSRSMFPNRATIQEDTGTTVDGEHVEDWANKTGYVNLAAQLSSPVRGEMQEVDDGAGSHIKVDRFLYLWGWYPDIDETMRAVVSSVEYDIETVDGDSHSTYTRLSLRLVR